MMIPIHNGQPMMNNQVVRDESEFKENHNSFYCFEMFLAHFLNFISDIFLEKT